MSSPISTPKGGGAVGGLGEKFSPDLFTGTGNFSVPIALPPGRNGFQPELGLQYSTGSGNSQFGLGWNLSVPGVMRKIAKGVPKYDDEKDTFILSGAEDLVAVKRMNIRFVVNGNNTVTNNDAGIVPLQNESGIITQYRPRTEGLFARIYHVKTNLRNCWKVMSKNGLTSWYGSKDLFEGDLSLVQNPDYETSVFAWKLTRTEDTFGNHILYFYEKEPVKENDFHKWDQNYLSEIKYADYDYSGQTKYMVRVLFNYENRADAFSDFKAGIEIRTTQRCKEIQIFTNPIEGEIKNRTYHFQYSDEVLPVDERPYNGVSLLCKVEVEGHDGAVSEYLPPLEFRYTHFKPKQQKFKRLEGKELPLASLANPGFELIDLFGNGLPDIVQIEGVVRYWRNLGNGNFDTPRIMKDAPSGFNLGDPDVQLVDANGDGRTDLLVNGTNMAGYFSMKHNASWDTKAFKKYKQAPTFSFNDPEVKLIDMTGDGITDVLRNGAAFEIFYHDKNDGWVETKRVPKKQLAGFPDVSFADPRIKLADMSGDGLQDIVQVYSGSIKYWPNKGYGNFGKPVVMKNSPRFDYPFDPSRLQLADIDGDGQADLIYIDAQKITFWINQSGNGWSEPFEITGTPFVTNLNGIRVTDILGSGTAGVFYSFDALTSSQQHRWYFLDLTGGTKPYLMHEMDNNMGALTRVNYLPSTRYYLKDQFDLPLIPDATYKPQFKNRRPWKTTLPFPVQVVSSVEVIDELSKGKLATEYAYHHGYWDGGEREFRGFGRVEQRDTETFERYKTPSATPDDGGANFNSSFVSNDGHELEFTQVIEEHYSPPIETRNWFNLGPIGDEFGDWMEIDFTDEYWQEDKNVLQKEAATFQLLQTLPRRAKRDALRAWRGSSLRSELYALDERDTITGAYVAGSDGRPYTVSESQYGIRLEALPESNTIASPLGSEVLFVPKETSGYVFFSFATSSRTTQWERGYDPMTQLSFTTDYDEYGQPRKQLSVALSRGMLFTRNADGTIIAPSSTTIPVEDGGGPMLSTASITSFAQKSNEETYIVDRSYKTISYEVIQQNSEDLFTLKDRVLSAMLPTEAGHTIYPILGYSVNYYDADVEFGDGLALGEIGKHGALARSQTLVLTDANIADAYGIPPIFFQTTAPTATDFTNAGYPIAFYNNLQNADVRLGYKRYEHSSNAQYATGWYAESGRTKYDWQDSGITNPKGLVLETKDVFESRATIEYDIYLLLPKTAKQWLNTTDFLSTSADYDYRVMQAKMVTDPNGNRAVFDFSPLGLLKQSGVIGKPNANEGDIITESPLAYKPSVLMEYDFFAFKDDGNPVWVKTIQREKHYQQPGNTTEPNSPEIIKTEYTDGFGRLLQTRTQAEDVIFGDPMFGDSSLPEQQGQNANAVGVERGVNDPLNVVVSGWKIYNNKGKVVEQYEPYFDKGFDYSPPFDLSPLLPGIQSGEKIRMFYDPRGNVIRTINPDNSEQWVIHGKPNSLESVAINNSWSFKNYSPTPWESYAYDANDLATKTNGVSFGHDFTPKSAVIDAMGRSVKTIEHIFHPVYDTTFNVVATENVIMKFTYDIRGNLLSTTDTKGRIAFRHTYDLRPKQKGEDGKENPAISLNDYHIDKGISRVVLDAIGKPIQTSDAKLASSLAAYDAIHRAKNIWALDNSTQTNYSLRQKLIYGDESGNGLSTPENSNHKGRLYQHFDEAGLQAIGLYDFKGNVLTKSRQLINDSELTGNTQYIVNWDNGTGILESKTYATQIAYDALNRIILAIYPEDVDGKNKVLLPEYNLAGALVNVKLKEDNTGGAAITEYVKHIAYNAKGQRLLIAYGNGMMTRHTFDKKTFRLLRMQSGKFTNPQTNTYHPDGGIKQDYAYRYDLAGNILQIKHTELDSGITGNIDELTRQFTYDPLNRLLTATGRECYTQPNLPWTDRTHGDDSNHRRLYTQSYCYDSLGNLLKLKHSASGNNFTRSLNNNSSDTNYRFNYHNLLNKVEIGTDGYTFMYDNCGNQLQQNADRFFEWSYNDLLQFFKIDDGSNVSIAEHYLYDTGGKRIKKYTRNQQGETEVTVYIDEILEYRYQTDNSGTIIEENNELHIMDDKARIATLRIGNAFSGDATPEIQYNLDDHLGNSLIRLDENGTLIDKQQYYPFGEASLRTFSKKRYQFCDKEKDEHSGLYYYGARYYCDWCCRFISIDPLKDKYPFYTPYQYAGNKPINYIDLDGLEEAPSPSSNTTNATNNLNAPETSIKDVPTDKDSPSRAAPIPESEAKNLQEKGFKEIRGDGDITKPHYERKVVWVKDAIIHNLDGSGQKTKGSYYEIFEFKKGESAVPRAKEDPIHMEPMTIKELKSNTELKVDIRKIAVHEVPRAVLRSTRSGTDFSPMTEGYQLTNIRRFYNNIVNILNDNPGVRVNLTVRSFGGMKTEAEAKANTFNLPNGRSSNEWESINNVFTQTRNFFNNAGVGGRVNFNFVITNDATLNTGEARFIIPRR